MSSKEPMKEVPDVVVDTLTNTRYTKGKFLGKGGFARCYELTDARKKTITAGKIVSKQLLVKKHQKDKMTQEIEIHRSLNHKNVVNFISYFEDDSNVYILLELCRRRSLMELHKRRRAVTEPEARYFTHQIIDGCIYLREIGVIHRDLKLGNLFLNDELQIKIGDFGLATRVNEPDERKKTLCGTPNYIAPEMLNKKGHSFGVDIWAIGCILYTLLVGKPPFETQSLKETYMKIKQNDYHVPSKIGAPAKLLISKLLAPDPAHRPTISQILDYQFFTHGYMPTRLPVSCLTMAPKFPNPANLTTMTPSAALRDKNAMDCEVAGGEVAALSPKEVVRKDLLAQGGGRILSSVPEGTALAPPKQSDDLSEVPKDFYLNDMLTQLNQFAATECQLKPNGAEMQSEALAPECVPVFWIGKWVDYSDKYGLGYQLCDNSVGVLFNDSTKLLLDGAGEQLQYMERNGVESYYTINNHPENLNKKMTLLKYFRNYMNEHLLKAGAHMAPMDGDELARHPCLRTWFRTKSAIILHLTNGTIQINFFDDHTKIILCPLMKAVTFIDQKRSFHTFKLSSLGVHGCAKELYSRIIYGRKMVERLVSHGGLIVGVPAGSKGTKSTAVVGGKENAGADTRVISKVEGRSTSSVTTTIGGGMRRYATGLPPPPSFAPYPSSSTSSASSKNH